jgi:hypothetical protein
MTQSNNNFTQLKLQIFTRDAKEKNTRLTIKFTTKSGNYKRETNHDYGHQLLTNCDRADRLFTLLLSPFALLEASALIRGAEGSECVWVFDIDFDFDFCVLTGSFALLEASALVEGAEGFDSL